LLSFDGSVFEPVLRLRAYAPHAGWQPAMVVDQDRAAQGEGDVAASQGRAVVAWARYVTTGTEVQSLLADASFDLASNLAPLGVQIEGDAGGLASVVSTPAGHCLPGRLPTRRAARLAGDAGGPAGRRAALCGLVGHLPAPTTRASRSTCLLAAARAPHASNRRRALR
jgi:hypothetical protein